MGRLFRPCFSSLSLLEGLPMYFVKVLILTDSRGEWWETCKANGGLARFEPGTAQYAKDKAFNSESKAIQFAKQLGRRCAVYRLDPPIRPSITYTETTVAAFA
jgi:hypothetical protein